MKIPEYLIENNDLVELDLFNRDRIVDSIYNYINENENISPIKIGVYGDWGIGKTYLLKLLQKKINNENGLFRWLKTRRKVIFLDIKSPENFQKFRTQFLKDIKESIYGLYDFLYLLIKYGICLLFIFIFIRFFISIYQNAVNDKSLWNWDTAYTSISVIIIVAFVSKFGEKVIDVISSHNLFTNYSKFLDEFYIVLYLQYKKFRGRKVVVIIDDLDRIDAKYVPEILLWLNRISSIEKGIVNIIIVADPLKLGQGIQSSYSQYSKEEGYQFLEKIVDTPYYLDKLAGSGKYLFWNTYKKQLISDFQGFEVVENFLNYLPENIRQLKRYFRFIYTVIDDLNRFGPNEIDFETFFFVQLMKLEHPNESLEFINEIVVNKIIFTPGLESLEKRMKEFKENLNDIQKKYFSYFEGRFINGDRMLEYYYFVSHIPKITDKEFHHEYILGDKLVHDLIKVFNGDSSKVLLSLANYKQLYYSKLVDQKTTDLMHEYQSYVEKVYSLIELTIGSVTDQLLLNPTDFTTVFDGITSYVNFTTDIAGLEYKKHRQIESKLIDKLINIIHPETLFFSKPNNLKDEIDEKIDQIYRQYLIGKLGENVYENKTFEYQVRNLAYKKVFFGNGIQELLSVKINDKVMQNYYFILYNLLIQVKESNSNDTSKILEVLESKGFKELVSKISFARINPRSLGSFEQDVLEAMPQQYENSINFLIEKVKELSPRHLNTQ